MFKLCISVFSCDFAENFMLLASNPSIDWFAKPHFETSKSAIVWFFFSELEVTIFGQDCEIR